MTKQATRSRTVSFEDMRLARQAWFDAATHLRKLASEHGSIASAMALGPVGKAWDKRAEAEVLQAQADVDMKRLAYEDLRAEFSAQQDDRRVKASHRLAIANFLVAFAVGAVALLQYVKPPSAPLVAERPSNGPVK